jgi:hypothetical protein
MKKIVLALLSIFILGGCVQPDNSLLGTQQSQVETRNIQSRSFDTDDRAMVMRSVISTLQDLGFIIGRADDALGTVSGSAISGNTRMTVSVREGGPGRIIVRANAQQGAREITDPVAYQNFFNSLGQSLFLDAHLID